MAHAEIPAPATPGVAERRHGLRRPRTAARVTGTPADSEWAAAVDTLPGTYTRVMRPAEFWDSVLVVPDLRERVLWRVDMARGTREPLGSQGAGHAARPSV